VDERTSGIIALTVIPQANGRFVCEVTPALAGRAVTTKSFHGQTAKHAIANALEDLARALRADVEAGQNVEWDAATRSPSGIVNDKRFHVIVHYERLVDEESKFEAKHSTLLGNSVIENAEVTLIQEAPDFPELGWKSRFEEAEGSPNQDRE
jgi:hypothetical protein